MTTQQTPQVLTELRLTGELKRTIDEAYVPNDHPIIVCYVAEDGEPAASFRGSAHVFSATALAVWTRNPESGMVKAAQRNATLLAIYREPGPPGERSRAVVNMRGRGRVASDEAERRRIYDGMVQRERDADPDYKGVGIVIELESVLGFVPGYRLQMRK